MESPFRYRLIACALVGLALVTACKHEYRVGDYVLVEWCDDAYPAYVLARKGKARYRVHFDGYESRWDKEVGFERILSRLEEPPAIAPPLCDKVARSLGLKAQPENNSASPYKAGTKVKVVWRGTTYRALIVDVVGADKFKVHYIGLESAWDEVVTQDRIVGVIK